MKKQDQDKPETAPTPTVVTYVLSEKAQELAKTGGGITRQLPPKGLGKAWRAQAKDGGNLRAQSLAVIAKEFGDKPFTAAEAKAAWSKAPKESSGIQGNATPGSRIRSFTKNGYFTPAIKAAE